jgi:two-component system, OmpR family, phosphate regulon sensor histidine kinase PhoR
MRRLSILLHPLVIFISAQLAWLTMLGIWIYWYISNYIIFTTVEDKISAQLINKNTYLMALITGLVMLVAILVGMYLIFIFLTRQLKLTNLYDNFIANITHELKSPLASIQLHLETLESRDLNVERRNQFIALMQRDATRLKQLIDSILEIARLEQKKVAHNFHVFTAEDVVRSIIAESTRQFNLSDQTIHLSGNAPCQCVVDRHALKIVLDNLVDNAVKYSEEIPAIFITLSHTSKRWFISIADNGIGIIKSDQKKIFHKFQRIYRKDIPTVKGTGLGLYWVKQIIRYHGGHVTVSSHGIGQGTTFRIELPIYKHSKKRFMQQLLDMTKSHQGTTLDDETE